MTKASSLLGILRQPIDAVHKTLSLSHAYTASKAVKDAREANSAYLESIQVLEQANTDFQRQQQDFRCLAYLTRNINKELELAETANSILMEYESALSKAKIAMELSYRSNKIGLLTDSKANNIVLIDAVAFDQVLNRVNSVLWSLNMIKDIKALTVESVKDKGPCSGILESILANFRSDEVFSAHLSDMIHDPVHFLDIGERLENIRNVHAEMQAGQANYNNLNCSTLYKQLNKAIGAISEIRDYWFVSTPGIANNTTRIQMACKEYIKQGNAQDQTGFYPGAAARLKRLDIALGLLSQVFAPVVLKETVEFTRTMDELGQHQHLDERAVATEVMKRYDAADRIHADTRYLQFSQTKNPQCHPHYVPKALSYLNKRHAGLIDHITETASLFNRVQQNASPAKHANKIYTLSKLVKYIQHWESVLQGYQGWLSTFLGNKEAPINSWSTFVADMPKYLELQKNLKDTFQQLDLTVSRQDSVVTPRQLTSALRDGYDRVVLSTQVVSEMQLEDQDKQKELKLALQKLEDIGYLISDQVGNISTLVNSFKEADTDFKSSNLTALYAAISDMLQINNWISHDLDAIGYIYR